MKSLAAACLLATGLLASGIASAASESENNGTFGTADGMGNGTVSGTIGDGTLNTPSNDVDVFAFGIAPGGTINVDIDSVTSVMQIANTDLELILVLWNSAYQSVADNPFNNAANGSLSYTSEAGGTYYLSVTARNNQPLDQFGNPLADGMGDGSYFEGWSFDSWNDDAFAAGSYNLSVSGVVPVPAAVWLLGSGLAGLAGFARRKKQS
jgi:hypothetical protein